MPPELESGHSGLKSLFLWLNALLLKFARFLKKGWEGLWSTVSRRGTQRSNVDPEQGTRLVERNGGPVGSQEAEGTALGEHKIGEHFKDTTHSVYANDGSTLLDETGSLIRFKRVFSAPLDTLRNTTLDLSSSFTDERFRFVDCDAFVNDRLLEIHESSNLPTDPDFYTAVSYVWFGLTAESSALEEDGSFSVYCGVRSDGSLREDGGPISMKVLEFACRYSSESGAPYLWLDRLCILQTSKRDKAWQIGRMYDVYEQCRECVVLPGGLQRLASVFDETSWADRAWTYQEAIITWDYAILLTKDWHRPKGEQHWLVEGECHWQYMHQLFLEGDNLLSRSTAVREGPSDAQSSMSETVPPKPCLIFGTNEAALNTLRRIMEYKAYNHIVEEGEETISEHTIRQLVLQGVAMRVSSRPVDIVFSILGLVGAQEGFKDRAGSFGENERFRATLSLVEVMLRQEAEAEDDGGDGDGSEQENSSTLIDVPLWASLEPVEGWPASNQAHDATFIWLTTTNMPTLRDLADVFDSGEGGLQSIDTTSIGGLKRVPLSKWQFEVTQTEDEPGKRASAIALSIAESDFLRVYHDHGGEDRVVLQHEEEGILELCRRLDLGLRPEVSPEAQFESSLTDLFVFGWSLKLEGHPYIRFYKFDISHLFD